MLGYGLIETGNIGTAKCMVSSKSQFYFDSFDEYDFLRLNFFLMKVILGHLIQNLVWGDLVVWIMSSIKNTLIFT